MPLGKQFENTYYNHPEGGTMFYGREEGSPKPYGHGYIETHLGDKLPNVSGTPLQGMLFPAATGTGRRDDPLVPHEKRMAAVRKAINVEDVTKYRRNLGQIVPSQRASKQVPLLDKEGKHVHKDEEQIRYNPDGEVGMKTERVTVSTPQFKNEITSKMGDKTAQEYMGILADTLDNTGYPTHELERTKARAVVDPKPGQAYAEVDDIGGSRGVKMNTTGYTTREVRVEVPRSGYQADPHKPIHNPKFWDQLQDKLSYEHSADKDALEHATHWHNPTTGHTLQKHEVEEWNGSFTQIPRRTHSNEVENLRKQGYVPNLFPGKGKSGNKHSVGRDVSIETGYKSRGYGYNSSKYHTRFAPDPSKPLEGTTTEIKKEKVAPTVDAGTLLHEIGHTRDPYVRERYDITRFQKSTKRADPMSEGIADAFRDRHVRHADSFEDTLGHSKERVADITSQGYGTMHRGWENDTHRALYAATRFHSGLSDRNFEDIPSRSHVAQSLITTEEHNKGIGDFGRPTKEHGELVNRLTLGKMYEDMPHIRQHLDAHGYGDTAKSAHEEYLLRAKGKRGEQFQLPGLENY